MNREDSMKKPVSEESEMQQANADSHPQKRNEDDDQHSYPGKLDKVEGQMNNGELGSGLTKEGDE